MALIALGGLLVVVAAGLIWQERRRVPEAQGAVVYGTEDAVAYVWERLPEPMKSDVGGASGVRRILEWEMHYLQQPKLRGGRPAVIGSLEAASYVQERAYERGFSYEPEPILAILELEAAYLAEIGAVADRADPTPT